MNPQDPLFHHEDPGTPETAWLASPRWEEVPALDHDALVRRWPTVLIAAAHPDDETLAVGALVADLAAAGADVTVLVATDGEASHPVSGSQERRGLARRRRAEVRQAVGQLSPRAGVEHLALPDGALTLHEERLAREIAARSGRDTLVIAPWTRDGHPDHDALGRAAQSASAATGAATVHYPLWLWQWGDPASFPWKEAVAHEGSAASAWRKRAALEQFPSQTLPWQGATTPPARPPAPPVVGPQVLARAHRLVETLLDPLAVLPAVGTAQEEARLDDRIATFDAMYDDGPDPWQFRGSFYEERRRALVLGLLGRRRYGSVLEVGCADGQMTAALLDRADDVLALDTSPRAVEAARLAAPGATVVVGTAPHALPQGPFDLVLLSEVGYFLTPLELLATLRKVQASLAPDGELLLCHWQHPTTGVPLDGALVHEQAGAALGGRRLATHADDDVRIEVWGQATSVAEREGRT